MVHIPLRTQLLSFRSHFEFQCKVFHKYGITLLCLNYNTQLSKLYSYPLIDQGHSQSHEDAYWAANRSQSSHWHPRELMDKTHSQKRLKTCVSSLYSQVRQRKAVCACKVRGSYSRGNKHYFIILHEKNPKANWYYWTWSTGSYLFGFSGLNKTTQIDVHWELICKITKLF